MFKFSNFLELCSSTYNSLKEDSVFLKNNLLSVSLLSIACILIGGCEKQFKADGYVPEFATVDATENKDSHFFASSYSFDFSVSQYAEIEALLTNVKATGVDNIGFMIISNKPIPEQTQKRVKDRILALMHKHGFISSRIVDYGTCVYQEAKPGVRINVLKYSVKTPDCSTWSEYVGDTDTNKDLPKYGFSAVYNLEQMIANKADLVAPRKYIGQTTQTAVAAVKDAGSAGGGGGGTSSGSSSGSSSSSSSSKSSSSSSSK
jgi:pilus biogenesis lipoprotein CpaD